MTLFNRIQSLTKTITEKKNSPADFMFTHHQYNIKYI